MKTLRLLFLFGLATGFIAQKVPTQSPVFTADDLYLEGRTSGNLPLDDEDSEDDGSGSGSGDYGFTDWMNKEEKYVKLTTVSSERVPGLVQTTTTSPNKAPTTSADSQHLTTTAKDNVSEMDKKNAETVAVDPTADWFTERTQRSPSSPPPIDTTRFSTNIAVPKDTDGDNSLDRWERPTSRDNRDQYEVIENEIVPSNGQDRRTYDKRAEGVISENLWERTEVLAAVIACGVVGFLCAVFLLLLLAYRMKKKDEGSYELGDTKLSNAQYHKAPTKEFYA